MKSHTSSLEHDQSVSASAFLPHWRQHWYCWLAALMLLLMLVLTLLTPHDQRRLHMPEPWSYALAAKNFARGKRYRFGAA